MTKEIIIPFTTNVLNTTLSQYRSLDYLFHFIGLNSSIGNVTDTIPVSSTVTVDDYVISVPLTSATPVVTVSTDVTVTAYKNQTIFDLCTRYYGSLMNVVSFMNENKSIQNINYRIDGMELNITEPNINNKSVKYFNAHNSILITGLEAPLVKKRAFNKSFNLSFN